MSPDALPRRDILQRDECRQFNYPLTSHISASLTTVQDCVISSRAVETEACPTEPFL